MIIVRTHRIATASYSVVAARQDAGYKKKYGALCHKLPGMILQNGIAQATGFLLAKGKDEHVAVMADLREILRAIGATQAVDGVALHGEIIAANLTGTMELTRRALDASGWMKRYVQGVLGITATGDSVADSESDTDQGGTP